MTEPHARPTEVHAESGPCWCEADVVPPNEADDYPDAEGLRVLRDATTSGGVTAIELRDARIHELEALVMAQQAEQVTLLALGDAMARTAGREAAIDVWVNRRMGVDL